MNYLDTNFAVALCVNVRKQTDIADRFVRKNSEAFLLSELAELECRRVFVIREGKFGSEGWARLREMLSIGNWHREPFAWTAVSERCRQLIDRFGRKLKPGTLDTLHVAHALHSGCSRFLSFDTDSSARVLAVCCRLKVYPDLTLAEKERVIR